MIGDAAVHHSLWPLATSSPMYPRSRTRTCAPARQATRNLGVLYDRPITMPTTGAVVFFVVRSAQPGCTHSNGTSKGGGGEGEKREGEGENKEALAAPAWGRREMADRAHPHDNGG